MVDVNSFKLSGLVAEEVANAFSGLLYVIDATYFFFGLLMQHTYIT